MTLNIQNLGVIKQISIDLSKKIILFCGGNSTGKTYASYILNAFMEDVDFSPSPLVTTLFEDFNNQKVIRIERNVLTEWLNTKCAFVRSKIGDVFGVSDSMVEKLFSKTTIFADYTIEEYTQFVEEEIDEVLFYRHFGFRIKKEAGSNGIDIVLEDRLSSFTDSLFTMFNIFQIIFKFVVFKSNAGVRMLTVERNSIYTFKTELSISRNELIDRIQQSDKSEIDIYSMLNSSSRRYPRAIRNSLRIANDLENVQKMHSDFDDVSNLIENELLQGEVNMNKNGDVEFHAKQMSKTRRLPFHLSSSIVKTMASFVIYLRYIAQKGDVLIIDEPEMNFHPDVQILLARIFTLLANKGLRIVVSTHSDYIIRELNNLMMADALVAKGKHAIVSDLGYYDDILLNYKDLSVLFFEKNNKSVIIKPLTVDEFGFAISSIDDTINKQNKIAETLFASLMA